jgi:hypothetical protein
VTAVAEFTPDQMMELFQSIDTWTMDDVHRGYRWVTKEMALAVSARSALGDPNDETSVGGSEFAFNASKARLFVQMALDCAAGGVKLPPKHLMEAMAIDEFSAQYKTMLVSAELKLALNQRLEALRRISEMLQSVGKDSRGFNV